MQEDKTKQQGLETEVSEKEVIENEVLEKDQKDREKEDKKSKAKAAKAEDKKITKLTKALEKAEKERDTYLDSYQRTFSEFNNFKKRNQTASACARKEGCADTVEKILPVIDNFERALAHAEESTDKAFADGVTMVYKQLKDIMESLGVKEIPAEGEPFDPNVHQAIQQVESEEGVAADTVVQVVQKGYTLGDKIIRHSMVIVSK